MGLIGYYETSVWNYHSMLHNIPEEYGSHLHHGGSLKSHLGETVTYWFLLIL